VPTSQQISVGVYRQTVAPAGTGLAAAVLGQPYETWTPQTDPTVGIIATTATTIGTTGPTLATNPIAVIPLNTQSTLGSSLRVHRGARVRDRHRERHRVRQHRQHAAGVAFDPDRGLIRLTGLNVEIEV
jgi:hypothetical protein